MTDLNELLIAGLIYSIKHDNDTAPLIKWLSEGGTTTPELSVLIADILTGKVKAKPQKAKASSIKRRCAVKAEIEYHQESLRKFTDRPELCLGNDVMLSWGDMEKQLKAAGYEGVPETKGEITRAAKLLTAHSRRITEAQLDEILVKRSRKK